MTRREIREQVFQILFRIEFHQGEDLSEQLKYQTEEGETADADAVYIQNKIDAVIANITQIDEMINEAATGWKTSRMGKVELTILRQAVYEMQYDSEVPSKVAINEAVNLAKKFGGKDSPAFINGVLAKLVTEA